MTVSRDLRTGKANRQYAKEQSQKGECRDKICRHKRKGRKGRMRLESCESMKKLVGLVVNDEGARKVMQMTNGSEKSRNDEEDEEVGLVRTGQKG